MTSVSIARADVILDFEGTGLTDDASIPNSYGDNPLFNVTYAQLDGFGNANFVDTLRFYGQGYGDLQNVIGGSFPVPNVGEVRIDSTSSAPITLTSFSVADWDGTSNNQTFRVYDSNYNTLFELTSFDVDDVAHNTIGVNVSASTLILQWSFPWGVGMDNISISAVPEPSSMVLLGMLSSVYAWRKRRGTKE